MNTRVGIQFGAGFLNLLINLYIIPRYSWLGAAWSSIATDGMLALALWSVVLWLHFSKSPRMPAREP